MRLRRMYKLPILGLLLALSGPAAAAAPDHSVKLEMRIEGLSGELHDNAMARIHLMQGDRPLSEADVRSLSERAPTVIQDALEPFGYYRAVITSDLDHDGARWHALFRVDPGPPLLIDSLDVQLSGSGAADPAFTDLVAKLPLHRGDRLVHSVYEQAKDAFGAAALRHGYLDARFDRHELRVDLDRYVGSVVLHYHTGTQYQFGAVEFRQDVIDPDLLQGYVTFQPGEPLDFNRLIELERALGNSPYFTRVDVRPRRDLATGTQLPIVVDLVPSKQGKYTAGVGYGTDTGPNARGMVELRRLNRRGHRGEIDGTISSIEQSAAAKYQIPWPYPRTDVLTFSTGYTQVHTSVSDERLTAGGVSLARLWAGWQETFALQYRREKFTVGLDNGINDFLVPEASWSRLRTNDPIDPTDGRSLLFRVSTAAEWLLSAETFARFEARGRWMRGLGKRTRLIGRAELGYLTTSNFRALPPSLRFFAGGAQSVRGFAYNSLGRRDEAGNVIGGEVLELASVEYEYRVLPAWGLAVFYDVGNAARRFRDPLEQGTGAGVRWRSPVGLVRVDFGVPISDRSRRLQLHLAIGPGL